MKVTFSKVWVMLDVNETSSERERERERERESNGFAADRSNAYLCLLKIFGDLLFTDNSSCHSMFLAYAISKFIFSQ